MTDESTGTVPTLEVGLDTEVSNQSPEFLGRVEIDCLEPGKYDPIQWHLAVRPLQYELQGQTGCYSTYYGLSNGVSARSKAGIALASLKKIFPKGWPPEAFTSQAETSLGEGRQIGKGQMIGLTAWWARRDISYGRDKSTGEERVASGVLVVIRQASAQEIEAVKSGTAGQPTAQTPSTPTYSAEDVAALVTLMVGKTPPEAQKAAIKSTLGPELKGAVLDGSALRTLVASGAVVLEGDIIREVPF